MSEVVTILKDFGPAGVLAAILWLVAKRQDATVCQLVDVLRGAIQRNNEMLARVDSHLTERTPHE